MKEAHKLIKGKNKSLPIAMMGHHPWSYRGDGTARINGNHNGLLLDVARWAKEGWVDEVVAAGYFTKGGTPQKAYAYMKKEVKGKCKVWLYAWVPATMDLFKHSLQTAKKLGPARSCIGSPIISTAPALRNLRTKSLNSNPVRPRIRNNQSQTRVVHQDAARFC